MIVENLESTFDFGKYKGQAIKVVALKDPSYIEWLCKNVELFIITNEIIDELSNYCLSVFFNDPERYLNEEGDFTICTEQHFKYQAQEITIGSIAIKNYQIRQIINKNNLEYNIIKMAVVPASPDFHRKVFDGEVCKKNLLERNNK